MLLGDNEGTAFRRWARSGALRGSVGVYLITLLCGWLASGCASVHAKAAAPPLDVPAPPPRVVEPLVAESPEPLSLPEDPRPTPVRPLRPAPTPPAATARPEPPKPEAPAATAEQPPKPAEEAPRPSNPSTTLQTTTAAQEGELERNVRVTLARATADLGRVNYRALNNEGRAQYNAARRFIQQADDAIHQKNLVLAKNLADKAAVIAAEQAGR